MKVAVKSLDNKEVGNIDLNDKVFGLPERADILHRMVNYQLAKRRSGNHKTKGVSEVSGTGRKPFAQKGTGRARASTLRAPQHRGGAVIFGPVVRSHATDLPKKFRMLALRTALSVKQAKGELIILDSAKAKTAKTKDMIKTVNNFGFKSALFVDKEFDKNFALSMRNIPHMSLVSQEGMNVYDILRCDVLVLTKDALAQIEERLK